MSPVWNQVGDSADIEAKDAIVKMWGASKNCFWLSRQDFHHPTVTDSAIRDWTSPIYEDSYQEKGIIGGEGTDCTNHCHSTNGTKHSRNTAKPTNISSKIKLAFLLYGKKPFCFWLTCLKSCHSKTPHIIDQGRWLVGPAWEVPCFHTQDPNPGWWSSSKRCDCMSIHGPSHIPWCYSLPLVANGLL